MKKKNIDYIRLNQILEIIQFDVFELKADNELEAEELFDKAKGFLMQCSLLGPVFYLSSKMLILLDTQAQHPYQDLLKMIKDPWIDLYKSLKQLNEFLNWLIDLSNDEKTKEYMLEFLSGNIITWHKGVFHRVEGIKQPKTIVYLNEVGNEKRPKKIKEMVLGNGFIEFIKAIDGAEISRLKKCGKCERIFFQPSARPKIYCSTRCRVSKNLALKRERDKKDLIGLSKAKGE
jgi:hypothetical protein